MNNIYRSTCILAFGFFLPLITFADARYITQLGDSVMVRSVLPDSTNIPCHRYYLMQGDRIRLVSEDGIFPQVPTGLYKVIEDFCDQEVSSTGGNKKSYRHKNIVIRNQSVSSSNIPDYMLVDMGAIRGGTIRFESQNGVLLQGEIPISENGIISFSKKQLVAGMGSDAYVIVSMSGGVDYDVNNDDILESSGTTVQGKTQIILPRQYLEQPWSIVYNMRSTITNDMLKNIHKNVSERGLYTMITESGVDDLNRDGLRNYEDILYTRMQDAKGMSAIMPYMGYRQSIVSGDNVARNVALSRIFTTENHIIKTIIANPEDEYDHMPVLKLESLSPAGSILYTLDGSIPMINASGTSISTGALIIPFQDKTLYFREMLASGTGYIYGSVRSFDLVSDWTNLSQEIFPYNSQLRETHTETIYEYKNQAYRVTRTSGVINPAYVFPKFISCKLVEDQGAGCDMAPYIIWSDSHNERVEKLVKMAMEQYIDDNPK